MGLCQQDTQTQLRAQDIRVQNPPNDRTAHESAPLRQDRVAATFARAAVAGREGANISSLSRFKVNKTRSDMDRALRQITYHARREIPYYRDLLADAPHSIGLHELADVPMTTKADLVAEQSPSRVYRAHKRLTRRIIGTSGTTGQSLFIHLDRWEALFRRYTFYRILRAYSGTSLPLSIVELGVGPYAMTRSSSSLLLGSALVRIERIPRLLPVAEQADRLSSCSPQVITGQATCLEVVAHHLLASGRRQRARLVVSRGEILLPQTRELLATAFDARIVDLYNCEEIGNVAYECPAHADRMHVNTDSCVLELVDESGRAVDPETPGRVVLTNLFSRTTPFIRYDIGDTAMWVRQGSGECDCGSRRPTIYCPSGRSDDFFTFEDGVRLPPRTIESLVIHPILNALVEWNPGLIGSPPYQIIQEDERTIRVRIAGFYGLHNTLSESIRNGFRVTGHVEVSVEVEEVATIPRLQSGKSQRIITRISPPESA